ncbi:unnamed protein product [Calypogeia fissa]
MARASSSSTKFASVNLNKSYGKPAAPAGGAQLSGSGGSRTRIASHGGMLLLTRPVRSSSTTTTPGVAGAAVLQKGAKLTVPLPVNLPSLRREHAGNDPNIALVGGATGASGWPKQQQQQVQQQQREAAAAEEAATNVVVQQGESNAGVSRSTPALSAGSTWGTSQPPSAGQAVVNPGANGDLRPSSAPHLVARSGVYTPPRARAVPVKVNAAPPPVSRPAAVEKAVVLRGEDFPTLQAALPPPPPPAHQRQKELQQKQREKQQELKDQHQKLQLLSSHKPAGEEPLQPQQVVAPPLQPAQPVSISSSSTSTLSPAKPSQALTNEDSNQSSEPQAPAATQQQQQQQQVGSRPGFKPEWFSSHSGPPPPVRVNQRSNWTDDEREPAQSLRPQGGGGPGQYSEWPDRPEREHFLDDPRGRNNGRGGDDYGFGRQSSQRENRPSSGGGGGFGRDTESGREGGGFGADGGSAYPREGNLNSSYSLPNNHNREERYGGREGMGRRDGVVPGRDGGYNNREQGGMNSMGGEGGGFGREGGAFGRQGGGFGRDGVGARREFVPGKENNLDRDGFGRPASGGRDFSFRDGYRKDVAGPRENFYKESGYGISSRDGPYRDNRRPSSGDYDGGRGRYGGDRFGRGGAGRFNGGSDFGGSKGGPFASGRGGIMGLDSGLDFNREKRFGAPYAEDAFARDFPDLPGLDYRTSAGLGESLSGVESKLIRRKKEEAKVNSFYDLEREAFEAELERVQKLQEQERLRKLEEKERAIEQARKEEEERERLAREEVERQLRLEEEARETAARAEQEALEAARKIEEEKRAREDEKRAVHLEEERRKENARRKLQELEERIAKREAEKKKQEEEALLPEEDRLRNQRQSLDYEAAARREVAAREEDERNVASLAGADQDDDERAPLRPSLRRPASPPMPRSQEEFSSRLKSPDVQGIAGRRMPDLRGGNAFEADRSRSFSSWRRDVLDNGIGSSLYGGREDTSEFQFGMSRDRMYPGKRDYTEREAFYGNSALTNDVGPGENPPRKDRLPGFQERRWPGDETGSSNKRSASPRATTPESDGGYLDSSYDREGDRHWGRDKIDRQRSFRDGKRSSPPPPSSYFQGPEANEFSSYGRLRQSLAKQPRVPPPPLRGAPLHRPPLKSARDLANSSPSPLLNPSSEDARGASWQQDGPPEGHSVHSSYSGSLSSESSAGTSKQLESVAQNAHRSAARETTVSVPEKPQARDIPGVSTSLRPQRSYLQSARGIQNESENENSEQQVADAEKETSSPRDDSSFSPASPESHVEQNEEDSEEVLSPSGRRAVEEKSEDEEADYPEDEDDVDADDEEYVDEVDDEEGDLDQDVDEEVDLEDELDHDDEGDLDEEADLEDEEVAGEWEDDVDLDVGNEKRIEDQGSAQFIGEYHSGSLEYKEEGESDMDYNEYEHCGEHEDVKHDYSEAEVKETSASESVDSRQQEKDLSYQSVPPPFLQHISQASVVPVQVAPGENYASHVQQPLSFMALSLPQSHATPAMPQGSSLVASLPVLQNQQDGPVTLQFGLLPSTSLLPASVPAIQIGSIQMPLHLHPQSGAQILGSQAPLFQFGQLGHQTPLASTQSLSGSQSQVQPQNANAGAPHLNGTQMQESNVSNLPGKEPFTSQGDEIPSQLAKSARASQPGQSAVGDVNSTDADAPELKNGRTGFRPERRNGDRNSRDAVVAPHIKALQRIGSEGAFDSSSSENSIAAPTETPFDNYQGGDGSWNRPYYGTGRGRGSGARWPGPPSRGRGRSGPAGGRGTPSGATDGSFVNTPANLAEGGMDGSTRMRPSRRSNYRRTEFIKVRDSTLSSERGFPDSSAGTKQGTGREKYAQSGWNEGAAASGNVSDGSVSREGHPDSASHHQDRKYYGDQGQSSHSLGGGRSSQSGVTKVDRSGSNDSTLKNGGRGSGYATSRPEEGVLGRYSQEAASDVSVLVQPGVEAPSDEDDFIEVRSKRQMLNDRREQKEKEMKAKTKAKEQAARKQRAVTKGGFQGDAGVGSKSSGLAGSEKRSSSQNANLEGSNSSNSRLGQTVISPAVVSSTSLPASNNPAQLPPIGTPAGGSADMAYDKRSKNSKPRAISAPGGNLGEADVPTSSAYENQDSISGTPSAWGGTRSTLQVVSLTQIQLEEAMKPVRFESAVSQQLPFGDRGTLVLEPVASVSSASGKDKPSASPSGPVGSLLAGEKIQFGAVTSPPIPLPSSRPITPGLNAVVGSAVGPRADGASDDNELKSKSKRLSGGGNEVSPFTGKTKRTRGDEERGGEGIDAEAEAAASAVAVAAISSDESVGSTHHGDGQNALRGVGLPGSGNKNSYGKSSVTSSHSEYWPADTGISMGDGSTGSVMIQGSGLEESMSVALPADLSLDPQTISHQGPVSNSSGLLHPSIPGGALPYRGHELGTMLGGPMFGFGSSKDTSQGAQGGTSGSVHDQGIANAGSGSGGWQPQHSGGVDSYYAGPPSSYAGPFINHTGGIPSIQGPPMLVYTNPFAQVSQFGQLGVSFMNPQQYLPSGKQPDWKHTPVSSTGVGMSGGDGGLGGIMSGQRSSGVTNNVQRMAPGPSVIQAPGPFDLNLSAPFQIPGVEVSMQSQWSHVPGPLHTVPISGPLMGFTMQSRHSRGPIGQFPQMMETTSGFNLVPSSNPVSSGLFQSVDPAAQFPDELGLGDSSSSVTNNSPSFRGPRTSNRAPPVSSSVVAPSGAAAAAVGVSSNKLRSGRRSSRVARGATSLGGGGNGGISISNVGMGPSSGASGQVPNGSRAPSPHLQSSPMPSISLGQQHSSTYADQRGSPQQSLPRVGISSGGWAGQSRKGGGPGRPPVSERGSSGDKNFVSSSSKLKQVYVVKPSSSPRRNIGDASSNLFSGSEVGQTAVGH